jgi:chemotaxis protein MotB
MALNRRSANRFSANIWPGFVDAMTALLLVLMFVLTIFMVVQFVLRDTITGQDEELDSLTNELSGLAEALGLEQARSVELTGNVTALTATLEAARTESEAQATLVASLSAQTENQAAQIAGFEEQVASLLAQNRDLASGLEQSQSRVAVLTGEAATAAEREAALAEQNRVLLADKDALEQANLREISEKEALQLALAQARDEIDESTEAARLAAAQREALEALIADLQSDVAQKDGSLADALALLAQSQADLEGSRASLSAALGQMGSSGEALSAAQAELAERRLTETELRARLDELVKGLSDAETAQLAEAAAAAALREKLRGAEDELTAMTLALEAQRKEAEDTLTLLAAARAEVSDADLKAAENLSKVERQAALLAVARQELSSEQEVSLEAQRKVALLNQQTVELRKQLDTLQGLLDFANTADQKSKVQIESLGKNLNTALARVAAEQKKLASANEKTAALEEAERKRLEEEAKDLRKFRSEFFGRLRDVLGSRDGIRIVGDRFVFSSEILFGAGSATLGARGQEEIAKVANIILDVADQIPAEIDWILRVDGHTDKVPLSGNGAYADNWELSQVRALSVVKYLISDLGVPAGRLAANGFGEFQPIVDGNSPEALALNRRIELKFTEK